MTGLLGRVPEEVAQWGRPNRSLGCQTPEHTPCDEATSGIKAMGGFPLRPALCPDVPD